MKLFYLLGALLLVFLGACSPKKGKNLCLLENNTILIDIDHAQTLQASIWFDTIEYIPLETSDSFLVSGVNHLKLTKQQDIYFISDKSFFLFDGRTGKGKMRISKLGNALEGYISVFDSFFDETAGQIELLDNNGKKVVVYDLFGNYLHSISLPFMPFMMTKTSLSDYWFYNNNLVSEASRSKVVHYDINQGEIVNDYLPIDQHLAGYFFIEDEKNLIAHNDELFYLSSPVDTIYRISRQGMEPAYVLDFGKYKAPKDFYSANYRDIMEFVETSKKHDYVFELPTFAINNNQVVVCCCKERRAFMTFHSLVGNRTITFSSLHDDFHFSTPLPLNTKNIHFCMDDEFFYFIITAEQFVGLQLKNCEMEAFMNRENVTELSNPILVRCKLKAN